MTSEFEDLEHALVMANKVNLAGAPGATKAEAMRDVGRMRNMFDALEAHTTTAFETTKEHRAEGHTSVVNYQKHHNRVKGPDASRRLTLAHRLRRLPIADAAIDEGIRVFRWHRRLAGDHKRNKLLQLIYKGA